MVTSHPIQLSIVNAVFLKSLAIGDDLETGNIVLTFDHAFYAKAQQVRWTVDRLGEFIHACHFSVSLESALKIQGWLTSYLKLELWHKGHYLES